MSENQHPFDSKKIQEILANPEKLEEAFKAKPLLASCSCHHGENLPKMVHFGIDPARPGGEMLVRTCFRIGSSGEPEMVEDYCLPKEIKIMVSEEEQPD